MVYDFGSGLPTATGRLLRLELPSVTLADGSPQQSVVTLEHNARGQVTAVVSPEGPRTELKYFTSGLRDGLLRRIVGDAAGARPATEYEYDAQSFPLQVKSPDGRVTTLKHNALGQIEELLRAAVAGTISTPIRQWLGDDGSVVRSERPRVTYSDGVVAEPYVADLFERNLLGRRPTPAHLAANTASPRHWRHCVDHDDRPVSIVDPTGARTDRCSA